MRLWKSLELPEIECEIVMNYSFRTGCEVIPLPEDRAKGASFVQFVW